MKVRGFFKPVILQQMEEDKSVVKAVVTKDKSPGKKVSAKKTSSRIFSCEDCGLDKNCKSPRMPVSGEGRKGIYVLCEAPGETEDLQNTQLVGRAGTLLRNKLARYGIDLDRDCWKDNVVCCRPVDNETPTTAQLKSCWDRVEKNILEKKPKFIWLMGNASLSIFYENRAIDNDYVLLSSWTKNVLADRKYDCWVFPMYHPSAVLREQGGNLDAFFELNLKWAISCLGRERPVFKDFETKVRCLTNFEEVELLLLRVIENKPSRFIFDYETNSVRPYRDGSKILTTSFYIPEDDLAYSFPIDYPGAWTLQQRNRIIFLWKKILGDPLIPKVAHNLKFEHQWSTYLLRQEPQGWKACTMNNQHILDSRRRLTGLKVQSFMRWGVEGYERDIKPFMKTAEGTAYNRLSEFPLDKLLMYGGMDSVLENELYVEQQQVFDRVPSLASCAKFFTEGTLALSDMEMEGIRVDSQYYEEVTKSLIEERNTCIKKIKESPEALEFEKLKGKPLNLGASEAGITNDMKVLLFDVMKIKSDKKTVKGNRSVDDEVLSKIDKPVIVDFLRARKIKKILEYVEQYRSKSVNGVLHPNFNLNVAETGRSSSDDPNFQNIPKRDKEARKAVRSGIVPVPGNILMEVDFSGFEVRGNALYSLDPGLIKYIEDPTTDMHRDVAADMFFLNKEDVSKDLRQYGKNGFVFPELYGDYYVDCARSIWAGLNSESNPILAHLKNNKISTYDSFEKHMKGVEDKFWQRLSITKKWRDDTVALYRKRGYVDSFFGFRRCGYLKRNQVINAPVQGTCFHMLLWCVVQVNKIRKDRGWKSKIVGQIHDSIVFDIYPPEKDEIVETLRYINTQKIREVFDWVIVPLDIDFSFYEKNWYNEKKEEELQLDYLAGDFDGFSLQKGKSLIA